MHTIMYKSRCKKQINKSCTDNENYQSSYKTLKSLEANQTTKMYHTSAVATLLYGSETWMLKEKNRSSITAAFLRKN